jgi:hypothetical protein
MRTAAEFMAKWDKPSWSLRRPFGPFKPNGRIDAGLFRSETGLTLSGNDAQSEFVLDLSSLPPDEFVKVNLSDQAAKQYLYNKYGSFFATYDNGAGEPTAFSYSGVRKLPPLDGNIEPTEVRAVRGGIEQMIRDLKQAIHDPRDLELVAKLEICTFRPHSIRLQNAARDLAKKRAERPI